MIKYRSVNSEEESSAEMIEETVQRVMSLEDGITNDNPLYHVGALEDQIKDDFNEEEEKGIIITAYAKDIIDHEESVSTT